MSMDSTEPVRSAGPRTLPPHCSSLRDILQDTRRALKNRHLFAHIENHGAEQLSAIFVRLQQLLQEHGAIVLRVEVSTLQWGDHAVLEDDARDVNFVFPLFQTGVRRLVIRPGVPERDFISFWTHVGNALLDRGNEDLLTRLWKESYSHINWVAHVEIDEPDDDTVRLLQVVSEAREALNRGRGVEQELLSHRHRVAAVVRSLKTQRAALDLQRCVGPRGDPEALLPELASERARVQLGVGRSLLDIATVASHPDAAPFLSLSFAQVALSLLQDRKLSDLCALASQAQHLLANEQNPIHRRALELAVEGLASEVRSDDARDRLVAAASGGAQLSAETLPGLTWLLVTPEPTPALSLLELSLPPQVRRALCDALVTHAAPEAVAVARKLRTASEALARELLDVVKRMELPKKVFLLEPGLQHRSVEVRRCTLQDILSGNEPSPAATAIGRAIARCNDQEERLQLIASLAQLECPATERFLIERLDETGLSEGETQALWTALLQLTTQSSLAVAMGVMTSQTRGMLGASSGEQKKASLVEAAGALGGIRALSLLTAMLSAESNSSRNLVKRAQMLRANVAEVLGVPV